MLEGGGSTISELNHKEITEKQFESIFKKLNMKIRIFHHTKETQKILNKTTIQLLLMSYLHNKTVTK